jgi:hypothetical protein
MFPPFNFFLPKWPNESLKQYSNMWTMGMSSFQTLYYRGMMIGEACQGRIAFTDPEFSLMSQEKLEAVMEGTIAGTMELQRILLQTISNPVMNPVCALNQMMDSSLSLLDVSMEPVQKKANANAKRLRNTRGRQARKKPA